MLAQQLTPDAQGAIEADPVATAQPLEPARPFQTQVCHQPGFRLILGHDIAGQLLRLGAVSCYPACSRATAPGLRTTGSGPESSKGETGVLARPAVDNPGVADGVLDKLIPVPE